MSETITYIPMSEFKSSMGKKVVVHKVVSQKKPSKNKKVTTVKKPKTSIKETHYPIFK